MGYKERVIAEDIPKADMNSNFDVIMARMEEIENTTPNADARDMSRAIQKIMKVVRDRL